jgi:hypothetical protein
MLKKMERVSSSKYQPPTAVLEDIRVSLREMSMRRPRRGC